MFSTGVAVTVLGGTAMLVPSEDEIHVDDFSLHAKSHLPSLIKAELEDVASTQDSTSESHLEAIDLSVDQVTDMTDACKQELDAVDQREVLTDEEKQILWISTPDDQCPVNQNVQCEGLQQPGQKSRAELEEMQCPCCSFRAASGEQLAVHLKSVHEESESFECCICKYETKWQKDYYKHMRTHFPGPPFRCDFTDCAAKCDRIQHLLYHRRNHTEERPFSCSFCPKTFKIKSTLIVHLRKHTGHNPFRCEECGRDFSTKGALQQHAVTHSEKRAFLCDQCGFSTKHQSHLISHRRIHAGDVLRCQLENCTYLTTKRSQLISHMQSHFRIKTFFCEQCGQGFVAKSHLKRHHLTHVQSKPFSCDSCEYRSNRKDKLQSHVQKHHCTKPDVPVKSLRRSQMTRVAHATRLVDSLDASNAYTPGIKFQKLVQKVDEQLRNRTIHKYTKASHVSQVYVEDKQNSPDYIDTRTNEEFATSGDVG